MITKTAQNWTVGNTVKVGFLPLTVVAAVATPGDYLPDAYILASSKAFYRFVPHNGLEKITAEEAKEEVSRAKEIAARMASQAIENVSAQSAHAALLASLMA